MAIYLKASTLTGNVTTEGFQNWVEIYDLDGPTVSAPVQMKTGQASDRQGGTPNFEQISFLKPQDGSSTDFFNAVHSGRVFPSMEIDFVTTGTTPVIYAKLVLSKVAVTHYSQRHKGSAGKPQEIIRLAYTQVEHTVIPRDASNNLGSPETTGYDIEKASKL